jgi:hypothetical protein
MEQDFWRPRCERPSGLVVPTRVDPSGLIGPTPGAARGPHWQPVAHGWYVLADVDVQVVEQRILNQAVRLPRGTGLTAWAALRWRGAAYFDGHGLGREILPVPLLLGNRNLRPGAGARISKEQFPPWEHEVVAGVPCASVARALYDETRWSPTDRHAAVAVDMTAAAGLITAEGFREYVESRPAWTGVYRARFAADHATDASRSPQESWLRLVWVLDAQLPHPLCNPPVFSVGGELLGYPDLFDPVAGLVGEYDGKDHLREDRRRADRTREERFRDHGLEYVAVVTGELSRPQVVVARLRAAYRRAPFTLEGNRRWTLEPPAWFLARRAG